MANDETPNQCHQNDHKDSCWTQGAVVDEKPVLQRKPHETQTKAQLSGSHNHKEQEQQQQPKFGVSSGDCGAPTPSPHEVPAKGRKSFGASASECEAPSAGATNHKKQQPSSSTLLTEPNSPGSTAAETKTAPTEAEEAADENETQSEEQSCGNEKSLEATTKAKQPDDNKDDDSCVVLAYPELLNPPLLASNKPKRNAPPHQRHHSCPNPTTKQDAQVEAAAVRQRLLDTIAFAPSKHYPEQQEPFYPDQHIPYHQGYQRWQRLHHPPTRHSYHFGSNDYFYSLDNNVRNENKEVEAEDLFKPRIFEKDGRIQGYIAYTSTPYGQFPTPILQRLSRYMQSDNHQDNSKMTMSAEHNPASAASTPTTTDKPVVNTEATATSGFTPPEVPLTGNNNSSVSNSGAAAPSPPPPQASPPSASPTGTEAANESGAAPPPPPPQVASPTQELPPPPPPPSGNVPPRRSSGRSRSASRERRNSDVPRTVPSGNTPPQVPPPPSAVPPQQQLQQQPYGVPPPFGGYPPSPYQGGAPTGGGMVPPPPHPNGDPYGAYQGRGRAWSGDGSNQPGYSSGGEGRPLLGRQGSFEAARGPPGHRRVDSNGSVQSYGGGGYGSVAPPSPRAPASPRTEFNARHEFMNATGLRPESPRIPSSPRSNGYPHHTQASPRSYTQPSPRGAPPPPPPGMAVPPMGSYSPHPQGGSTTLSYSPGGAQLMGVPSLDGSGMPPPSPAHSYQAQPSNESGGEAVYVAQRRSKTESSRRRHMRQQSAQLFMENIKGQEQPLVCRDLIFLLLFAFHLTGMVYLSNTYGVEAFSDTDPSDLSNGDGVVVGANETASAGLDNVVSAENIQIYYPNLLIVACFSGAFAMAVSTLLLGVMTFFARRFVQVALFVIIALSFAWGTVGIGLSPKNIVPITGIIALALSVAYTIIVWDRIPFAASNLVTALSAVRAFPGTILVALFFQALGCGWCIYYAVIVCGIYDSIHDGRIVLSDRMTVGAYILLGISFYWTFQVLLNAVQVSTAAVIGSWWYQPEGEHTVKRSSFKTLFYSMGSVCFGSLFVGPVRLIRQFSVLFRPSTDEASLLCLHECLQCLRTCITTCVDELAARFNPWAFTYCGLYGYGFLEAGQLATDLFDKRGWTTIVSDDLVPNVLLMTSLVVGGVTGCFGYLLAGLEELHITSIDEPSLVSFVIGIVMGLVTTSILFGAISSSVNAVIVCFATSPVDFEENHPELSHNMRAAWREVWPGALDIVDMSLAMAQAQGPSSGSSVNGHYPPMNGAPADPQMAPLL